MIEISKTSMVVNGENDKEIVSKGILCQGNSMTLLLVIIIIDILNALIYHSFHYKHAKQVNLIGEIHITIDVKL